MVTAATVEARAREGVADGTARRVDGRSHEQQAARKQQPGTGFSDRTRRI